MPSTDNDRNHSRGDLADDAKARQMDAFLDAPRGDVVESGRDRPWWETDPRAGPRQ